MKIARKPKRNRGANSRVISFPLKVQKRINIVIQEIKAGVTSTSWFHCGLRTVFTRSLCWISLRGVFLNYRKVMVLRKLFSQEPYKKDA